MAKRGERRPWRVRYEWDSGASGVVACGTEDEARAKADTIRANATVQDRVVTVTVEYRKD